MRRPFRLAALVCVAAAAAVSAAAQTTFTNTASIGLPAGTAPVPATLYPSTVTVTGMTRPIARVVVTLVGFGHTEPDDLDLLLVSPTGRMLEVWSDAGGTATVSNATVTLLGEATTALPDAGPLGTGAFRPADYVPATTDVYPSPAPAGPYNQPAPSGAITMGALFAGMSAGQANGTWSLYAVNDGAGNAGAITGGWRLTLFEQPPAGSLIISEFRLRGMGGATDEFVEVYNTTGADFTVVSSGGTGFGIAASDGILRCTIPNGTTIPVGGHFLCVNSAGYSLGSHPAGNGTTATGDATFTTNIPDNAGIALFNNDLGGAAYTLATRLDAAGPTTEANTLYREGAGLASLTPFSIDYAWVRDDCGKGGSTIAVGPCTRYLPRDSDSNGADFYFVDTNGTSAGGGQRLGAPEPQNLSSPRLTGATALARTLLDECADLWSEPNDEQDLQSDPANNSTFGTTEFRRRFTNTTGTPITRLRFRIVDLMTFPSASGFVDARPRTSADRVVTVDRTPCGSGISNVFVRGTTLETPPSQPNGGGFQSTFFVPAITQASPLAPGATIELRFLFGLQQLGTFKVGMIAEGLPVGGHVYYGEGDQSGIYNEFEIVTAAEPGVPPVPEAGAAYALSPARPNPTTGGARLDLVVERPQHVTADVVDTLGRRLAVLHDGPVAATRTLTVDGGVLPTGVYIVRVRGEHFIATRPLTVVR